MIPYFLVSGISGRDCLWRRLPSPAGFSLYRRSLSAPRSAKVFCGAFVASKVACRFSMAAPYPSISASLSWRRKSAVTGQQTSPPVPFVVLGGGHIDIQPLFAGTDPKAVDLKTAPDGDVGVGQQVSHRSDRPDTHIQLERQVPRLFPGQWDLQQYCYYS